jgi:single-stranded-DNA-specific exonuclease
MIKVWKQKKSFTSQMLQDYSDSLGFKHSIFVPLLVNRGIESEGQMKDFFEADPTRLHDPFLMLGMSEAVQRILEAIDQDQKIMVYGDYDVDGTTSVALVYQFLEPYASHLSYYIPDRHKEGYGISKQSIDHAEAESIDLIIALDCGIRSVELVDDAKSRGIDYIICDHHLPGKVVPNAIAVLDPKQNNCNYPYKELSGCGIGFKLCEALYSSSEEISESPLKFVDLVAISIVSDLVELRGENRVLVKIGLKKLGDDPLIGLKMIIEQSIEKDWVDVEEILFMIGPRINAAGRLASANSAVELLLAKTEKDGLLFSEILSNLNRERRAKDEKTTHEALEMIKENATYASEYTTVVYHQDWHKGVIGIVASRLQETYYRPTIVLTLSENKVTGSARSINNFDIHDALTKCSEHLLQFGGHRFAAGMTLLPENVQEFCRAFEKVAQASLTEDDLIPKILFDLEIDWRKIDESFYTKLKRLGPFGPGNMQALFVGRNLTDSGHARTMGANHEHLKLNLWDTNSRKGISAIGFKLGMYYDRIKDGQPFDMVFSIDENHFRGQTQIQLNIKDLRPL